MSDLSHIPSDPMPDLSRAEKAAIVVRFLLSEGADLRLTDMPQSVQARLAHQMGHMRYIDRRTLAAVVTEFARELEGIGLAFPRDLGGAIAALDGKICPLTAARLRKEAGVKQAGDPWLRLAALESTELAEIAERESVEVAAILVSKLPVKKAADLLGELPGPKARRITLAVGKTAAVTPDAVYRIGVSLAAQLDDLPPKAFDQTPERRLGAILNLSRSALRDELLDGLSQEDQTFAKGVRDSIFTFADIPLRLAPRDIPTVIKEVPRNELILALSSVTTENEHVAKEFVLTNISKRMADGLREEIAEGDPPLADIGEQARAVVVLAISAMVERGELTLLTPPETPDANE